MIPFFSDIFGNPSSDTHTYGWEASQAVESARQQIASVVGAKPEEIFFTSGASESNNLAIKGTAQFLINHPIRPKNHILTCATEHKSVLESCRSLEKNGVHTTYLPVNGLGIIDLDQLSENITDQTFLVSIMAVNNEIGVIQNLKEIGKICRSKNVYFHVDAAQGFGKIKINVDENNIDMMSISSHKIYGPKGVGAIYIRKRPKVKLFPILHGGGQERGIRSGTVPSALCVGLGEAAEIMDKEREKDWQHALILRNKFLDIIMRECSEVHINGCMEKRVPINVNLCFSCVESEGLMTCAKDVAISAGSACSSAFLEPSYVICALGITEDLINTATRISFGRNTTEEEAEFAAHHIAETVNRLRRMSPLWDSKNNRSLTRFPCHCPMK
ncbi:cysteine desulfurase IscS [Candidatus Hydrogenosomobacter endosymbioticus]|uniref:Cysteine desulfurase n=2 Tax=Candidatus Hydrogenosomobacter endosymbioticus TaxID=2558174 RepID=A0ABM7V9P4_9PROT|nr:cysteine desulfurase IscS [Candidatus Hydrogenosomobacter endosymbioticus]